WDRVMAATRQVQAERMLRVALLLAINIFGSSLPAQAVDELRTDKAAAHMAAQIARRLPTLDAEPFGLVGRATFRIRMRGGLWQGLAYLLRLSFSPTEEDWKSEGKERRSH